MEKTLMLSIIRDPSLIGPLRVKYINAKRIKKQKRNEVEKGPTDKDGAGVHEEKGKERSRDLGKNLG